MTSAQAADSAESGPESGPESTTWTIAEVADEFDVTHRAVRHYEELGLISPERRGTQRLYHRRDRIRLALIMRGRRIGFPLEEIRTIIDMYDDHPGEAGQLRYLLSQIGDRREDLESRRRDIEDSLAELDELQRRCQEDLARLPAKR
ncbi:MerR family transcriptional regulator [Ornithinimicrobium faecis]|uniref:MerR family transcriptional regulator n=1 Tax=Ornithinimicrobium faecis TaxID=2934158 RepID=UPI0021190B51|nr:MerR family DNA-binding transcriptional regulator [Ornithinimicrobium sp. HY1745]